MQSSEEPPGLIALKISQVDGSGIHYSLSIRLSMSVLGFSFGTSASIETGYEFLFLFVGWGVQCTTRKPLHRSATTTYACKTDFLKKR